MGHGELRDNVGRCEGTGPASEFQGKTGSRVVLRDTATVARLPDPMIVHLVDGTYELFRHFYGDRRFNKGKDRPLGAVRGVLQSVLQMIEQGATHVGVATDHVIESFRNDLWPGYKTVGRHRAGAVGAVPSARGGAAGDGRRRLADGRARGGRCARRRRHASLRRIDAVEKVCIWTPDKDLAQCVFDGSRGAGRPARQVDPRCGRRAREVRRRAAADPGLSRAGRRCRRRLSGHRGDRAGRRGAAS